ncbi:VOC family protein [Nocardia sp. NPDC088792]|uniref:VOC family protein n=1 Tax=Nocardia sp. NPDC088792 TaxID=3364332 RepID=UPI00381B1210
MTAPAINTVAWFQIGSDTPEEAKSFYNNLFGWTFASDPDLGGTYDLATYAGGDHAVGGITHTDDAAANHAIFFVLVADVAATVAEAERLGAKIDVPVVTTPSGLVFAHLLDTSGNRFGVFNPGAPQQ